MRGDITTGLHHVDYILETDAGWYRNILSTDFIVHFPYPATSESVPETPVGCVFSDNEVQCKMKNFEPTRKDNLSFGFIDTNEWTPTMELRSRVEQYPDDADAWYKLGEKYYRLGFWGGAGQIFVHDQHLVDLSIEAFEKAIDLNHKWGNAHLGLAYVLWFSNPKLAWKDNAVREKLRADDPLVQRVLLEMQLAASHGITEQYYYYDTLAYKIRSEIPDLELSLLPEPIRFTSAPALPIETHPSISNSIQQVDTIAAGNYHTCVLTGVSEVKCRGWNVNANFIGDVTALVVGDYYTCMLSTSSGVKCVGRNKFGQLGDGTTTDRNVPVDVVGLTVGVSALVAGDNHACALITGGGVKCWGRNYFGQLGNGTTAYSLVPVDVDGLSAGVETLVAGNDHTCALMEAGEIKCWGANEAGQLGDSSLINRLRPVDAVGLPNDVISLAAGFAHTCSLSAQGQVMCWGDNNHGQLGDSDLVIHTTPVIVAGLDHDVVKLVAGNGYSCALTSKGGVKCWGRKQLYPDPTGNGVPPPEQYTPYDVDELASSVVDLTAGNDHICGLLQNGRVKCWGLIWFAYDGPEVQFDGEPTATPPGLAPLLPTHTPIPLPTATPTETSSPTKNFVWGLVLLVAVGLLVLLLRRYKN